MTEFPLTLEAVNACKQFGLSVCGGAPNIIRGGSQYGNLSVKEIWKMKLLDVIVSDYHNPSLLNSIYNICQEDGGLIDDKFIDTLKLVTENPAKILGMLKGKIQKDYDADLILVKNIVLDNVVYPEVVMSVVNGEIKYACNPLIFFAIQQTGKVL
ncbi:MAG: amidohydrolase family protein [Magnetococcus sp. YQC-5]